MAMEQVVLGLDSLGILISILVIIFMVRNRKHERLEFERSLNAVIFSVFLLLVVLLINTIKVLNNISPGTFAMIQDFSVYVGYLVTIADVFLIPLFAICLLVGVFIARENLE